MIPPEYKLVGEPNSLSDARMEATRWTVWLQLSPRPVSAAAEKPRDYEPNIPICWRMINSRLLGDEERKAVKPSSTEPVPEKMTNLDEVLRVFNAHAAQNQIGGWYEVNINTPGIYFNDHPAHDSIGFCSDGKTAAIGLDRGEPLRFWDPRGGKPPVLVSLPKEVQPKYDPDSPEEAPLNVSGRTVLSPDCTMAATVLDGGWVAVWDVPSRQVFQVFPASTFGGAFGFRGLAFSPDGRLLATGNSQGVVEVWEIDAAARDAKRREAPAATLPEFLKASEE